MPAHVYRSKAYVCDIELQRVDLRRVRAAEWAAVQAWVC